MKRLLILLTAIFIINIPVQAEEFEVNTLEMRDYDEICTSCRFILFQLLDDHSGNFNRNLSVLKVIN